MHPVPKLLIMEQQVLPTNLELSPPSRWCIVLEALNLVRPPEMCLVSDLVSPVETHENEIALKPLAPTLFPTVQTLPVVLHLYLWSSPNPLKSRA